MHVTECTCAFSVGVWKDQDPRLVVPKLNRLPSLVATFTGLNFDDTVAKAKEIGGRLATYAFDSKPTRLSGAYWHHYRARLLQGEVVPVEQGWWRGCDCGCVEIMRASPRDYYGGGA